MDHIGVLKRAWKVTWRYKILWLFGLFAGGTGGGGGGGGGTGRTGTNWVEDAGSFDALPMREMQRIGWWLQDNIALVAAVIAFFVVFGLAMFIISIAAKGGLVHLVNEAEEGRPVRGMDGWAAGFQAWFRVLGIGIVLYVPYGLLVILVLVASLAPLIRPLVGGGQPGVDVIAGMCGGLALGGVVLLVLGILVGLLETLAVRHAVLDRSRVFASIGGAWTDIRVRFKDVFVMWLLTVTVGIGFGIAVGMVAAVFVVAIVASVFAEAYWAAGVTGFALFLAILLPSAIFGAFTSAIWTVFFRRLTGREVLATAASVPGTAAAEPSPPIAPPAAPGSPSGPTVAPPVSPPGPLPPLPPEQQG